MFTMLFWCKLEAGAVLKKKKSVILKRFYAQIFKEPEKEGPKKSPPPNFIMWLLWLKKLKVKTEDFTSFQGGFSPSVS